MSIFKQVVGPVGDRSSVLKIGPLRLTQRFDDRAFAFQVGRFRPGRNPVHGTWEPIGGRADWNMEFGHVLMLSGRMLDPRPARRRLFEERGKRDEEHFRLQFADEGLAEEIAGGARPPADGYL